MLVNINKVGKAGKEEERKAHFIIFSYSSALSVKARTSFLKQGESWMELLVGHDGKCGFFGGKESSLSPKLSRTFLTLTPPYFMNLKDKGLMLGVGGGGVGGNPLVLRGN